jgi:hypothetical protein
MHGILAAIALIILVGGFLLLLRLGMSLFGPKPINPHNPLGAKERGKSITTAPE